MVRELINKINEGGGPINPKKGDQRVLKDGGQRWLEINFREINFRSPSADGD